MTVPSLMVGRRFSPPTRLRLQLVFARALEGLAETYQHQAAEFVRRLKPRLTVDEALQRYFREVGVPAGIEETVRSRALISLAGLIENQPQHKGRASSWTILRPDYLIGGLRRRVQYVEETNLDCRLAASISDEAVAATHVRMALETADVLADEVTPDQAIMLYVKTFNLNSLDAQVVFRTAMSQWAELHPLRGEAQAKMMIPAAEPERPRLELRNRAQFGVKGHRLAHPLSVDRNSRIPASAEWIRGSGLRDSHLPFPWDPALHPRSILPPRLSWSRRLLNRAQSAHRKLLSLCSRYLTGS